MHPRITPLLLSLRTSCSALVLATLGLLATGCAAQTDDEDDEDPEETEPVGKTEQAAKRYCQAEDVHLWTQYVVTGNKVTAINHREIRFTNCGKTTVFRKPDIAFATDLACRKVAPNRTTKWVWQYSTSILPVHFRGLKAC